MKNGLESRKNGLESGKKNDRDLEKLSDIEWTSIRVGFHGF